jgi:Uma2 family endonuclease
MTVLPRGREFTREDLDAMPDDGNRYEIIDGLLIVTPAPSLRHQGVVTELLFRLRGACPRPLRVLTAPFDVALGVRTIVQPDLLAAPRDAFSAMDLPGAPLLAVDVLSPSTRTYDLNHKKAGYERAGCQSYWVIDPEGPSPTSKARRRRLRAAHPRRRRPALHYRHALLGQLPPGRSARLTIGSRPSPWPVDDRGGGTRHTSILGEHDPKEAPWEP